MSAYVYILKDEKGNFYIGSTIDLKRRINQHRNGHTATTNKMKNPKLVFCQQYANLTEARFIEKRIKKLKRKDYIQKIIQDGFIKIKA